MLKKPPRVRDNNGALQVRLRLGGRDHFINRIGRFDDPVAQARGQAICAEIWLLQGGNGGFVLQALPKTMNINLDQRCEALLKEMLRKISRYGSVDAILNEA